MKVYDPVTVIKTGKPATIIEIDDNNGKDAPIYLVEIDDTAKGDYTSVSEVVFWCEQEEIKPRRIRKRR